MNQAWFRQLLITLMQPYHLQMAFFPHVLALLITQVASHTPGDTDGTPPTENVNCIKRLKKDDLKQSAEQSAVIQHYRAHGVGVWQRSRPIDQVKQR